MGQKRWIVENLSSHKVLTRERLKFEHFDFITLVIAGDKRKIRFLDNPEVEKYGGERIATANCSGGIHGTAGKNKRDGERSPLPWPARVAGAGRETGRAGKDQRGPLGPGSGCGHSDVDRRGQ